MSCYSKWYGCNKRHLAAELHCLLFYYCNIQCHGHATILLKWQIKSRTQEDLWKHYSKTARKCTLKPRKQNTEVKHKNKQFTCHNEQTDKAVEGDVWLRELRLSACERKRAASYPWGSSARPLTSKKCSRVTGLTPSCVCAETPSYILTTIQYVFAFKNKSKMRNVWKTFQYISKCSYKCKRSCMQLNLHHTHWKPFVYNKH